jgi:outer membrane lipoprotein SlyB
LTVVHKIKNLFTFRGKYTMRAPVACLSAFLLLTGCAKNINSQDYSEQAAGEVSETFQGMILSARNVTVKGADKLDQNGMGLLVGGAGGAIAGNQFGAGSGNLAATVGGVVIGAALGALAQSALAEQPGVEYIVKVTMAENIATVSSHTDGRKASADSVNRVNEKLLTLVQGIEPRYTIGQKVFVLMSAQGRARIIPDLSGAPQTNQQVINEATTRTDAKSR